MSCFTEKKNQVNRIGDGPTNPVSYFQVWLKIIKIQDFKTGSHLYFFGCFFSGSQCSSQTCSRWEWNTLEKARFGAGSIRAESLPNTASSAEFHFTWVGAVQINVVWSSGFFENRNLKNNMFVFKVALYAPAVLLAQFSIAFFFFMVCCLKEFGNLF